MARLVVSGILLVAALVVALVAPERLVGIRATTITRLEPDTSAFRLLVGLVQGLALLAPVVIAFTVLRRQRFRLLASVVIAGAAAWLLYVLIDRLVGGGTAPAVRSHVAADSWLGDAGFPQAAVLAAAAAVTVGVEPWLSRSWQRAAWVLLLVGAIGKLVVGTVVPLELALALLTGTTMGLVLLVALGVPDRRLDARGVAAALAANGLDTSSVRPAEVKAKGSRPFVATGVDGHRYFVKVLGADQRAADLLYRAYRFVRLHDVGDARPAASLKQAVEHQALVGLLARRAGVRVPRVDRVAEAADGSALLVMDAVDGVALETLPPEAVTDDVLQQTWAEVDRLHQAGIAHRSLRTGNVVVDGEGSPWLVDFSFSETGATDRQRALDVAELLASLSVVAGPERPVAAANAAIGPDAVGDAVPLLQPLALSSATRHAVHHDGLLGRVRGAAAEVSGHPADKLADLQRVRPRTLLTIAVAAGGFYFLLPQLANVDDSWRAFQSAQWSWLAVVIAMSGLTYLGATLAMLGTVRLHLRFGPVFLAQLASSFINRVTPANVGGMALNGRLLQKSGADAGTAVAAVGLNSVAGAVVHVALIPIFFLWAGSSLAQSFSLPSGSKILVVIAALAALAGAVVLTRWGRRTLLVPLRRGIHSSIVNLRDVAKSPGKLALLFGGSLLVTLAYIAALGAAVKAFGGDLSIPTVGAVYLGASAVASAAPTPGNLGALEATLVAGLTGVGMEAGPAVSTVLTYRLATYWLPILPAWLAWHLVQRWKYV